MLRACAFDLGNTLVDDTAAFESAVDETDRWLQERGVLARRGSFASVYTQVNRSSHEPFVSHTYGELSFFARTFAALGIAALQPGEGLAAYRGFLMRLMALEPQISAGLAWLRSRGLKVALVTNESVARVEAFLAKVDAKGLFDEVIISQAIGAEKPDPAIFREALARLRLSGPEMVLLGDNEVADGACRQLGIPFVLVTAFKRPGWGWEPGPAHQPDHVIERIDVASLQRALGFLDPGIAWRAARAGGT